jgi:23S rRNA (adenine2030-N6)-methyltransferase
MNYLHHYHAGNFADVWKHALLIPIIRGLQRKEKGFLYLDTHAGRGSYDLSSASQGDTLERRPEFPEGIGRLWGAQGLPAALADYVDTVKRFDRSRGNEGDAPKFYPGSPRLARLYLREQDRLAACELHPSEFAALEDEFFREKGVSVHQIDGYTAVRAMLPPLEKRALVLIDPPFEQQDEFARVLDALAEAQKRLPAGTLAVWYPLTQRARADEFLQEVKIARRAPAFTAEIGIAGEDSNLKMRGCGLLVVNPPWQVDREFTPIMQALLPIFAQENGAGVDLRWLVEEK